MAKAELHPTDGFGLSGWMVTDLHLQGAELLTFALVHQFAQSKAGVYKGNVPYLSAWTGWAENTCRKYLVSLVKKGLLKEIRGRENNVPFCFYELTDEFYKKHPSKIEESPLKNCGDTPQKTSKSTPQNLRGDNKSSTIISNDSKVPPFPPTVKEVADYCRTQGFADPDGFADYYVRYQTENGWMTGKGANRKPIDNWKLNVIAWGRYRKNETFAPATPVNPATKDMSIDEFNSIFR